MPPYPPSTTAGVCVSVGNTELGCRWGVLGVCRLTGAQAAICHPTLACLILIPSPAWPSRPAVSSPQRGFLLGGGRTEEVEDTKAAGEVGGLKSFTAGPFDLVPGPMEQTAQTDISRSAASSSSSSRLCFNQPHRPQGLTETQRGGG
ncbi:hypothetical protein FQA47_000791 [Oryzias melastigma]|uniref:Uncharacterized protein n=1 Tax=Oryzias melastigma TaxID=30732 RepID=A0A834FCC8_ORYME|nr:hypothetical protein FQA47_000791 [Oryzias melastigma]